MQVLQELTQGTNEWLEWRSKGLGGSDIASIMHLSPWKSKVDLWLEKTGQIEPEDMSTNFIVQRGHALEPEAREHFEKLKGYEFPAALFEHDIDKFLKFSCDGYNEELNEIIEVKCNGAKSHELAIKQQKIPEYYMTQIQYGLYVSKANKCYYISYNPDNKETPFVSFPIYPDVSFQLQIISKSKDFWLQNVLMNIKPETKNESMEVKEDTELFFLVHNYKMLSEDAKEINDRLELATEELKSYLNKKDIKKGNCENVFFSTVERKGNIDYAKVPELNGVDLEKYRKEKTSYIKIEVKNQ